MPNWQYWDLGAEKAMHWTRLSEIIRCSSSCCMHTRTTAPAGELGRDRAKADPLTALSPPLFRNISPWANWSPAFSTYYMYMRMHFWVHDVWLTTFCRYGAINPFNFLEGMNYVYPRWLTKSYLTRDSLMDYIQKLHSIPSQLVEIQVLMNLAVQLNRTNFESSMVWTGDVIERECFCLLLVEKAKNKA